MSSKSFDNYSELIPNASKSTWFEKHIKNLGLEMTNNIILLTKKNANIINQDIEKNDSYSGNFSQKIFEYYCQCGPKEDIKHNRNAILDLIRMEDLENSTNVWRYKKNRLYIYRMVDFIIDPKNNFFKNLEDGDTNLVEALRNATEPNGVGPKSLASKICHKFSWLFFNKDNYYKNDSVVRRVMPYYLNYYKVKDSKQTRSYFDNLSYEDLHNYLDNLRKCSDKELTRADIDHILWYCYRSEKI